MGHVVIILDTYLIYDLQSQCLASLHSWYRGSVRNIVRSTSHGRSMMPDVEQLPSLDRPPIQIFNRRFAAGKLMLSGIRIFISLRFQDCRCGGHVIHGIDC